MRRLNYEEEIGIDWMIDEKIELWRARMLYIYTENTELWRARMLHIYTENTKDI